MKKKRIDLYVQRQKAKKQDRAKTGSRTKVGLVFLLLLVVLAAFLFLDTNRMEKKIETGNAVLNDPANLDRFEEINSLNQREAAYLSVRENLDGLDQILQSYPEVGRDLFSHFLMGNAPGITLSNISYTAATGQFTMSVEAASYSSWTQYISKLEKSPFITGFEYRGYQRDLGRDAYFSSFSFQLVDMSQSQEMVEED